MLEKMTLYFEKGGERNSQAALEAAKTRALEIKPDAVIVTSSSGKTALLAAQVFEGTGIRIIGVPSRNICGAGIALWNRTMQIRASNLVWNFSPMSRFWKCWMTCIRMLSVHGIW